MSKKKNTISKSLPIRSSSQIKEDESRLIFEKSIRPWMISSWMLRDFGIDAVVEITKPMSNSTDQIVTGKRFSVQLKSSDSEKFDYETFSLVVPKEKITYWYGAIEPVLLIFIDLKNELCFFKWIDPNLIKDLFQKNENWIAQQTVSVKFDRNILLDAKRLLEIEKYVIHWKRPAATILTPGNYFKYSTEAKKYFDSLCASMSKFNIKFLHKEAKELKEKAQQVIYTIAVVGPSRAGKSTLINCLLQKEISPVGMLPTTGIPITVFPKDEDKTIILFKGGKELVGTIDNDFIRQYTSQDENPNNDKNVSLVSIHIINTLLEKGFALCDVPGLDDPDNEIRAITKTALYNVNAIIYVINAAPMLDGGFSITKQMIEDLNELGGRMDKLFLVFNKIDVLDNEQINRLKAYVDSQLEKFNISQYLPTPPLYISSKDSFNNRKENNTDDSVGVLEKEVWQFLLSNNKTGLHKILGSYADAKNIIEKQRKIINASLLNAERRTEVENKMTLVKSEINEVRSFVSEERQKIYVNLKEYIDNSFANILSYMKTDLETVTLSAQLPGRAQVSLWLENNAHQILSDVHTILDRNIYELQSKINQWISEKLNQVEFSLNNNTAVKFAMPDISKYTGQINFHLQDKQTVVIGVLESFILRIGNFIINIFFTVEDSLTPPARLRQKSIHKIVVKSTESYNNIATAFSANLNDYLNAVCKSMEEKSIDRTSVYLGELSSQLGKLDKQMTSLEKNNLDNFLNEVTTIENEIESNFNHLKEYTDGIERLHKNQVK